MVKLVIGIIDGMKSSTTLNTRMVRPLASWSLMKSIDQRSLGRLAGTGLSPRQRAVFLHHGQAEIDNNLIENAIRPTAVGKKNWMFVGGEDTGGSSAILYTKGALILVLWTSRSPGPARVSRSCFSM